MKRDEMDPLTRAVSDTLDEILVRHHGIMSSSSNPESFIKWLGERGYEVRPVVERVNLTAVVDGFYPG